MKYLFWLTLFLLAQAIVLLQASNETDSLRSVLMALPAGERMERLSELALRRFDDENGLFPKWFYREAFDGKGDKYKSDALYLLVRHYYGTNSDSMRYYIKEAEPLFLSEGRYEDLCRMKAWNIYSLSAEGKQEAVLPSARELVQLAKKIDFPEGEEMANQALANSYLKHGLKKEGVALYEEVLSRMERRNAPVIKRFNILRQLVNASISEEDHDRALELLKACLLECEEKGLAELDAETSLDYGWYVYFRTKASDACSDKNAKEAKENLEQAESLVKKHNWIRDKATIDNIKFYYYQLTGRYAEALAVADDLLQNMQKVNKLAGVLDIMEQKAKLYYLMGNGMAAAGTYQQFVALKDSFTSAKYYGELANLRTQHDVDKLELKNKQMELEASETHSQILIMGGGLILLLLACGTLGFISYSRHKYSKQLQVAKEKAEEADRLKSAFLANMNHEIRTPLNAIVGFSQVLIDEEDQEARRQFADIIQSNNDLLQRLISDVLDISKIESNTISLHYVEYDLPVLMNEIYNVILLRMHEGVELQLADCYPCMLYIDRNCLTQVLTNLLTNAIKHTKAGFIRFGYEVAESEVCFFVQDTGEGIPEEQQEQIFSRFVQLDDWDKGVGLGLAICKGLLEKMNGTIRVTSKVGEGSVFYVKLPRV